MSKSSVKEHTAYVRAASEVYNKGKVEIGFYILTDNDKQSITNPFRKPVDFFWDHWRDGV